MRKAVLCCALLLSHYGMAVRLMHDDVGRNVTVPDHPHRVICLAPSVTDTVYALKAAGDVVAISDYTEYPPEAARQKPSVGDLLQPSLERIAALRPDLVIALASMNSADTIHAIERLGVPVFFTNPSGLAGIYRSIDSVGRLLGREKEAAALIQRLRAREAAMRGQTQAAKAPTLLLVLSMDPPITAGRGAFITEMMSVAGARSVTADLPQEWLRVSLEALLAKQPDCLLLIKGTPFGLQELRQRPGWSALNAVHLGCVIQVDDRIQVPGPIAFDGLDDLARQLKTVPVH
jgi:iron complex transport system substrate-binding protein